MSGWVDVLSGAFSNLVSGFAGAAIGGVATLFAAKQQITASRVEANKQSADEIKRVLLALHAEVDTVWKAYARAVGNTLAEHPTGQPFLFFFPVDDSYFAVYTANTAIVGRVSDSDLGSAIVGTYVKMFGLVHSFQLNNALVDRHQRLWMQQQLTPHPAVQAELERLNMQMADYAFKMREAHARLEENVRHILPRLQSAASA